MTQSSHLKCLAVLFGVGLLVAPVNAFKEPEPTPVSSKAYQHSDLYIGNILVTVNELDSSKAATAAEALARLGGDMQSARIDRRSGRFGTLISATPLLPGRGVGNDLAWAQEPKSIQDLERSAREAFGDYLAANAADLGIDINELAGTKVTVHNGGGLIQIHVGRQIDGVTVRGSYINAVINEGNLILLGTNQWGDADVSALPTIAIEDAHNALYDHLGSVSPSGFKKGHLEVIPMANGFDYRQAPVAAGYSYRLAWVMTPQFASDMGEWEAIVDASTGELLAFRDVLNYATTRQVTGGVLPVSNDGVAPDGVEQPGWPMPYAFTTNGGVSRTTTTGGQVAACLDGAIATDLTGPYIEMIDNCGVINESAAGNLDLGSGPAGTDCVVPAGHSAGDTKSSRTGFYELNKIMEMGRGQLPNNVFLQSPLSSEMNINLTCNATSGAGGLRFYRSGGGCANTGELAGVFDHEWGHSMDRGDATPGVSIPGEGIADIYASLRYSNSCIGRNFFPGNNCGGYGDPCVDCTGIRDIDFGQRASGNPHDIAWIDANCGSSNQGPCGGSTHCEGSVYAEAVWDLWNRDLPNTGSHTARETATRLTYVGAGGVGTWFNCTNGSGTGNGCNANGGYLNYLAADDDNGNLADGTPNMQDIFDAFNRHGIACVTPTVTNAGCAGGPVAAPTGLVATAKDRGASLAWNPVAGATRYKVYRTEGVFGCDFGKTIIGETVGTTFVDDSGLMNGREYFYSVMAFGASDSCHGAMTSCSSATPVAGPNMAVDSSSATAAVVGGDSDPFLDNCEAVDISFDISNIGTGSLTNIDIVSAVSSSHPDVIVTTPLPSRVQNSLAACGIAQGTVRFSASGMAHNDVVEFDIEVTSPELAGQTRSIHVSVPFVESDLQSVASQTFSFESSYEGWTVTSGTFDRNGSQGGADGTSMALNSSNAVPDQCDRALSPVVVPTASTTLSLWNNFVTEDDGGVGDWYDRANVAVLDADGNRNSVEPSGGRLYNAVPGATFSGCNDTTGWAGNFPSWAQSTFSAAALGSAGHAGNPVQIEVTYSTDPLLELRGFAFDQVTLTNFQLQVPDTQPDCAVGIIFTDGFESGNTTAWDSSTP